MMGGLEYPALFFKEQGVIMSLILPYAK